MKMKTNDSVEETVVIEVATPTETKTETEMTNKEWVAYCKTLKNSVAIMKTLMTVISETCDKLIDTANETDN